VAPSKPKQPTPSSFRIDQNNFPSKFEPKSNQNQEVFNFESNHQPFNYGVKNRDQSYERQGQDISNSVHNINQMSSMGDNFKHNQNNNREYNRPADTKYTPATDPKKFFNNQFHTADKFFDLSGAGFENFDVQANNNNYKLGKVTRPNVETFNKREHSNLSKEVKSRNKKKNEETEKMRDMRSKLFDNREPGGYFIKVFNNDGNNYSIRDGNFHKKSGRVESEPQSHKQTEADEATRQNSRGTGRTRADNAAGHGKQNSWRKGKPWSQQSFHSSEFSNRFPFSF